MIKTVSIDMSTCDEDFENRIFGKVIEQEGDNLICEFDSANYDFKQENVIKQLKEKLNIAIDALKYYSSQEHTWDSCDKSQCAYVNAMTADVALKKISKNDNYGID